MKYILDTYCGLYCGACPLLKVNNLNNLKETAKKWNMEVEDLKCHGCKSDTVFVNCTDCKIKLCAEKRNLEFCFECDDYPCSIIKDFNNDEHPHHSIVLKNLEEIKQQGLQKWLKDQETRWQCPECGLGYSWYEETCQKCGTKLYNAINEENKIKDK